MGKLHLSYSGCPRIITLNSRDNMLHFDTNIMNNFTIFLYLQLNLQSSSENLLKLEGDNTRTATVSIILNIVKMWYVVELWLIFKYFQFLSISFNFFQFISRYFY